MTKEEVIKWLESLKAEIGKSKHRTLWHYAEALDMAIEALQAEPITRCKECKYFRLCNEDTHLIACGYEWCSWWQRPVISTGYCHCGADMRGEV